MRRSSCTTASPATYAPSSSSATVRPAAAARAATTAPPAPEPITQTSTCSRPPAGPHDADGPAGRGVQAAVAHLDEADPRLQARIAVVGREQQSLELRERAQRLEARAGKRAIDEPRAARRVQPRSGRQVQPSATTPASGSTHSTTSRTRCSERVRLLARMRRSCPSTPSATWRASAPRRRPAGRGPRRARRPSAAHGGPGTAHRPAARPGRAARPRRRSRRHFRPCADPDVRARADRAEHLLERRVGEHLDHRLLLVVGQRTRRIRPPAISSAVTSPSPNEQQPVLK